MKEHKPAQYERVYLYMMKFGSISGAEAFLDLGIMHLPRRIADLIEKGIDVKKRTESVKNRFGEKTHYTRYYLESEEEDIIDEDYWEAVGKAEEKGKQPPDYDAFSAEWKVKRAEGLV